PLMPIGPARIAEPHRGFEFNMAVLGAGFSLVVLAVTGIAAITGWRAARAEGTALGTAEVRGADRPSRVASRVGRAGVAPSVIDGHQIPTVGIDPLRGSVFPTLIKGRPPATPDEIVLGAKTLRLLHATVGETLAVNTGAGAARQMRVVGEAVFPSMGHGSFNPTGLGEGAATVAALLQRPHTYSFILARHHGGIPTPAEMNG